MVNAIISVSAAYEDEDVGQNLENPIVKVEQIGKVSELQLATISSIFLTELRLQGDTVRVLDMLP